MADMGTAGPTGRGGDGDGDEQVACVMCSKRTGQRCGCCGTAYCGQECQREDWDGGGHTERMIGSGGGRNMGQNRAEDSVRMTRTMSMSEEARRAKQRQQHAAQVKAAREKRMEEERRVMFPLVYVDKYVDVVNDAFRDEVTEADGDTLMELLSLRTYDMKDWAVYYMHMNPLFERAFMRKLAAHPGARAHRNTLEFGKHPITMRLRYGSDMKDDVKYTFNNTKQGLDIEYWLPFAMRNGTPADYPNQYRMLLGLSSHPVHGLRLFDAAASQAIGWLNQYMQPANVHHHNHDSEKILQTLLGYWSSKTNEHKVLFFGRLNKEDARFDQMEVPLILASQDVVDMASIIAADGLGTVGAYLIACKNCPVMVARKICRSFAFDVLGESGALANNSLSTSGVETIFYDVNMVRLLDVKEAPTSDANTPKVLVIVTQLHGKPEFVVRVFHYQSAGPGVRTVIATRLPIEHMPGISGIECTYIVYYKNHPGRDQVIGDAIRASLALPWTVKTKDVSRKRWLLHPTVVDIQGGVTEHAPEYWQTSLLVLTRTMIALNITKAGGDSTGGIGIGTGHANPSVVIGGQRDSCTWVDAVSGMHLREECIVRTENDYCEIAPGDRTVSVFPIDDPCSVVERMGPDADAFSFARNHVARYAYEYDYVSGKVRGYIVVSLAAPGPLVQATQRVPSPAVQTPPITALPQHDYTPQGQPRPAAAASPSTSADAGYSGGYAYPGRMLPQPSAEASSGGVIRSIFGGLATVVNTVVVKPVVATGSAAVSVGKRAVDRYTGGDPMIKFGTNVRPYVGHVWPYVDGQEFFSAVHSAIARAKRFVVMTGWWITPQILLERGEMHSLPLADLIRYKAEIDGVKFLIVVWASQQDALFASSPKLVFAEFGGVSNVTIYNQIQSTTACKVSCSNHQKYVCVDGAIGFVGGLDLAFNRWDSSAHSIDPKSDKKHPGLDHYSSIPECAPSISQHKKPHESCIVRHLRDKPDGIVDRMPWHDAGIAGTGSLPRILLVNTRMRIADGTFETFFGHDVEIPYAPMHALGCPPSPHADSHISVTWERIRQDLAEFRPIFRSYIEVINGAKEFIYVENQFFMSIDEALGMSLKSMSRIPDRMFKYKKETYENVELIVKALEQAIRRGVTVMLVLPVHPDDNADGEMFPLPGEDIGLLAMATRVATVLLENHTITRLQHVAKESGNETLFTAHCPVALSVGSNGMVHLATIYVHTKLLITETAVICGTANLNNRSMFVSGDTEIAAVLRSPKFAETFIRRIASEHIGTSTPLPYTLDGTEILRLMIQTSWKNIETANKYFVGIPHKMPYYLDITGQSPPYLAPEWFKRPSRFRVPGQYDRFPKMDGHIIPWNTAIYSRYTDTDIFRALTHPVASRFANPIIDVSSLIF